MKKTCLTFIVFLLCLDGPPLARADDDPAVHLSGTDVVFYAPDHPYLFRFIVMVDGRPIAEHAEQLLSDLFKVLDQDQDGILSSQERKLLPSERTLAMVGISGSGHSPSRQLLLQGPRSSVKTKEELRSYIHWLGLDSLSLVSPIQEAASAAPPVGQVLFQAIDVDHNNRISQAELKAAAYHLRKMDLNNDEIWMSSELILSNPPIPPHEDKKTGPTTFALAASLQPQQFGRECLRRYPIVSLDSSSGTGNVPAGHLPAVLTSLDKDQDGKLSAEEWSQILHSQTPDRIFVIRRHQNSNPSASAQLAILDVQGQSTDPFRNGKAELKYGPVQLSFRMEENPATPKESNLKESFGRLDRDKNDYVDRNEASNMKGLDFFEADTDQDGKIFWEEYRAGIIPLFLMAALKTRIEVDESGFDLFTALASAPQQGLTQRVFMHLPERVLQWDSNQDGEVTFEELPRNFHLVLGQGIGTAQLFAVRQAGFIVGSERTRTPLQQLSSTRPVWFSNMDRNMDGDLSPREFLGDAQTFEKFDANHDGLIDGPEAVAAQ